MLSFLTNGVRRVFGMLEEIDVEMATIEEQVDHMAEWTGKLEVRIADLSERFTAMCGETAPSRKPVNRLKATTRRAAANGSVNGRSTKRAKAKS